MDAPVFEFPFGPAELASLPVDDAAAENPSAPCREPDLAGAWVVAERELPEFDEQELLELFALMMGEHEARARGDCGCKSLGVLNVVETKRQ
jgi:hypothetical protein